MSNQLDYRHLKLAIINQAVDDWDTLLSGKAVSGESFISIKLFFESEWGQMICEDYGASWIFGKLMEQLRGKLNIKN